MAGAAGVAGLADQAEAEVQAGGDGAGKLRGMYGLGETVKTARIEIMDPAYYGERIVPFDWEKTLVHELLHLKTCLVSSNVPELQERVMHQLIDDLARALVSAKRSLAEPASQERSDKTQAKLATERSDRGGRIARSGAGVTGSEILLR